MSVQRPGRDVWRVETAARAAVLIDAAAFFAAERAAILSVRDRLPGEHCGVPVDAVAASCPACWNGSPTRPRRSARAA